MDNEEVVLEQEDDPEVIFKSPGEYHFHPSGSYRFRKTRPENMDGSPTQVEVVFNG